MADGMKEMLVDDEERSIIMLHRGRKREGHGRIEIIYVKHELEHLHVTNTLKRRDLVLVHPP